MSKDQEVPTPGSNDAIAQGCTCPVLDNSHGRGIYGGILDKDGRPMFWVNRECPVHWATEEGDRNG